MKALTLTQPWATLVAIGAKRIETRGWSTDYRGPLAIHAAKGWSKEAVKLAFVEPFRSVLAAAGYKTFSALPRACVVATCELVACKPIDVNGLASAPWDLERWPFDEQEQAFGDYTPGRYAWLLASVQPFVVPMSARGMLGLWNWEGLPA